MNRYLKILNPKPFGWFVLLLCVTAFTPAKYLEAFLNSATQFCGSGSANLEPSFKNTTYLDSIKWTPPVDTTTFIGPFPVTLTFDSFAITGITGLPPGITFECEEPGTQPCHWYPTGPNPISAFIKLTGNPGMSAGGIYKLYIQADYWAEGAQNPIFTITDSTLFIYLFPCSPPAQILDVVEVGTTLTLGNVSTSGYHIGTNGVTATGTINSAANVGFISNSQVLLNPNFVANSGSVFTASIGCP